MRTAIDPERIRAYLKRILSSRGFLGSPRLQDFLQYVVNETLEGRKDRIKGFTVALEVFQRAHAEDSTVVRVEAARLRRHLDDYYADEGSRDEIHITIPKGTYAPSFERVAVPEGERQSTRPKAPPRHRRIIPTRIWLAAVASLTSVGAVVGVLWLALSTEEDRAARPPAPAVAVPSRPVIAVLPFEDMTDAKTADSLAAGLTEDVITSLSTRTFADVIALSSMVAFKGKAVSPQQVGHDLTASHVVQGSIRGELAKLRFTVQLVDTQKGLAVWAERFDRELDDELELQDQLAREIVEGLSSNFAEQEAAISEHRQLTDPEAFALYKQTLNQITPQSDASRNRLARLAFERVIEMAPNFAGGYAGVAYTYAFRAFFGNSASPDADARKALELAEKAISIDYRLGLPYSAKAYAYLVHRDFDAALAASTNAITLQPNAARSIALHAFLRIANGEAARGVDIAKRALRLDPLAARTPYLNILTIAYFHNGEYEKALQSGLRHFERGGAHSPMAQGYLAATYAALGRLDEARAELEQLDRRHAGFDWEDWIRRNFRYEQDVELVLRPLRDLAAK